MIKKYSSSKAGRKALKELLPDIEDQIAQMKRDQLANIKAFDEKLRSMRVGQGVFGDFARSLIEAETMLKDYLKNVKGYAEFEASGIISSEFQVALDKVHEYWSMMLESALTGFTEQMLGFENEALSAQERVFSLMEERESLSERLRDLSLQRLELDEQALELEEAKIERTKKEADLRQKIADIMTEAAEDEAEIRRRGVLEAQISVAEQKANEIRKVRDTAKEEIADLQDQLNELRADKSINKQTQSLAEARRRWQMDLDRAQQDMKMNSIRLDTANRVAAVEGQMFGLASNRFDLARRQGELELQQATLQVKKWEQTRALVESIVKGASGYEFNPPAGFPLLKIQVGDIYIDNSANTQNNNTGTKPPAPGPGGGGPRERWEDRIERQGRGRTV
jgi:hypothetical protein